MMTRSSQGVNRERASNSSDWRTTPGASPIGEGPPARGKPVLRSPRQRRCIDPGLQREPGRGRSARLSGDEIRRLKHLDAHRGRKPEVQELTVIGARKTDAV